jgi:Predicted hydrolases or acyltransferases (alpha/beta hydrolase superfamily)
MPFANNAGYELYYEDNAAGTRPLVFVPGFGGVGSFWRCQQQYFAPRHRVITVDHRGTGSSSKEKSEYSIGQMAEDVLAVLDRAKIDKATIVGHSTGGAIAQTLAALWPDRVENLVLSSTWCRPGNYFRRVFEFRRSLIERGDTDAYHVAGLLLRYQPSHLEVNEGVWTPPPFIDSDITIRRINAVIDSDMLERTRNLPHRSLIIATKDDLLVPKFLSDELAATIPNSVYVVLEDGGHFHPETKSEDFNTALSGFL